MALARKAVEAKKMLPIVSPLPITTGSTKIALQCRLARVRTRRDGCTSGSCIVQYIQEGVAVPEKGEGAERDPGNLDKPKFQCAPLLTGLIFQSQAARQFHAGPGNKSSIAPADNR
jgi:hypothetical protein